ncbi:hypothetical protein FIE12Z_5657 [Fusarium flagelliforme]|uniref:Uncharacterized protein n=1 Tax=Fusarium flagelliforme TaxID=2675880 RepID=A0A395MSJ6_9HYPO|nr:hypothetical protein FIE12Z_5657 [Fusarium flagelliforme]
MDQGQDPAGPSSVSNCFPPNTLRSPHVELAPIRALLAIRLELNGGRMREIWFRLRQHLPDMERTLLVEEFFTLEEEAKRLTSEMLVFDDLLKEAAEGDWNWGDFTEDMIMRRIQQKRELIEERWRQFEYSYGIEALWPW